MGYRINLGLLYALCEKTGAGALYYVLFFLSFALCLGVSYFLGCLPGKKVRGLFCSVALCALRAAGAVGLTGLFFGFYYTGGLSLGIGFPYLSVVLLVMGDLFPLFFGKAPGDGVGYAFFGFLILAPVPTLIAAALGVLTVFMTQYLSAGIVCGGVLLPMSFYLTFRYIFEGVKVSGFITFSLMLAALFLGYAKSENLKRIYDKTEPRFRLEDLTHGKES